MLLLLLPALLLTLHMDLELLMSWRQSWLPVGPRDPLRVLAAGKIPVLLLLMLSGIMVGGVSSTGSADSRRWGGMWRGRLAVACSRCTREAGGSEPGRVLSMVVTSEAVA